MVMLEEKNLLSIRAALTATRSNLSTGVVPSGTGTKWAETEKRFEISPSILRGPSSGEFI
jgi:hypothetical protein